MAWANSDRRARLPRDWDRIRASILERDRWLCQLHYEGCTRIAQEVDHIGADIDHQPHMLRAVCTHCHAIRSSRQGAEARAAIAAKRYREPEPHPGLISE